ncbi:hypothetical protein AB6A40_010016 [Gnathostoma spinigerum]|uniref:Uncharacterized protein n=1 Tax=Gnathostoma spinigerum TaxID=75299 RepID=A0ABD6EW22_9BILA
MFRFFLCLLFHLSSLISVFCGVPFIDTYSTLNYEPVSFRKKRLADGSFDPLRLRFASLNRTFHLSLLPVNDSSDPFDSNLIFDVDGVQEDFNHRALLFTGFDENYDNSVAYGSIIDGVFDGHIHYADGLSYSIERITRYFPPTKESSKIHSIIYEDKSINHPAVRSKRSLDDVSPGCALNGNIRQKMEEIQRSAVVEVSEERGGSYFRRYIVDREKRYSDATKTINGRQIYSVRACYIYLQADQKLYRHIFEKEGNNDHVRTREEIASLFYNHVKAVNQIYEATNFRGIQGINFVIQRISVSHCV